MDSNYHLLSSLIFYLVLFIRTSAYTILETNSLSLGFLRDNVPTTHFNDTRRGNRVVIKLSNFSIDTMQEVGNIIDQFIASRPWWIIELEPYSWKINRLKVLPGNKTSTTIVFQRYSKDYDIELLKIANTQYSDNCSIPLHADSAPFFREWGNAMHNFESSADYSDNGHIFTPYIADSLCVETHYLDANFCPNVNNKYTVAFLPTTNCPLPRILSSCNSSLCLPNGHYFSNASSDGVLVNDFRKVISEYQLNAGLSQETPKELKMFYTAYCGDIFMKQLHTTSSRFYIARHIMFGYGGLLFRQNYHFRSLVSQTVHTFMTNVSFPKHGNCVAVHIRRSDRATKGPMGTLKVKEWCNAHKNDINAADLGCDLDIPFGALTLEHYLNASAIVSRGTRNVFIMTDDGDWLKREVTDLTSEGKSSPWSIYVLPAPPNHRAVLLENGVNFLASLEIARQCSGLVGHSRSAVTNALHKLMCFKHSKILGRCPPLYDFGTTHW